MGLLLRLLLLKVKVARKKLLKFFQFANLYFLCVMYFLVKENFYLFIFCLYIYRVIRGKKGQGVKRVSFTLIFKNLLFSKIKT